MRKDEHFRNEFIIYIGNCKDSLCKLYIPGAEAECESNWNSQAVDLMNFSLRRSAMPISCIYIFFVQFIYETQ